MAGGREADRGRLAHWAKFLWEFAKAPRSVGSPFATARWTVERQLEAVDWARARYFVEFGPGTGEFTRSILRHLPLEATLIAIESEEGLASHLRESIEDRRLTVHTGSATDACSILGSDATGKVDYVLSGLPFSALEKSDRARIVAGAAQLLKDDGEFMAYQVRRTIEPCLVRGFAWMERRRAWLNMPPYHLYRCARPKRD